MLLNTAKKLVSLHVFSYLAPVTCFRFEFCLVHCVTYTCSEWPADIYNWSTVMRKPHYLTIILV